MDKEDTRLRDRRKKKTKTKRSRQENGGDIQHTFIYLFIVIHNVVAQNEECSRSYTIYI